MQTRASKEKPRLNLLKCLAIGLLAGLVNGFFGSGGGLVIVPAAEKTLGMETKKCFATSVFCVFFISIASAVVYFIRKPVALADITPYLAGGLLGGFVGGLLMKKLKSSLIKKIFALLLILAAVRQVFF